MYAHDVNTYIHTCIYHVYVSGTLSLPWQPGSEAGGYVARLVSASPSTSLSDEALLLPEVQDKVYTSTSFQCPLIHTIYRHKHTPIRSQNLQQCRSYPSQGSI